MPRFFSHLLENWPITMIVLGFFVIATMVYSCESRQVTTLPDETEDNAGVCAALLKSGIDSVQPDNLGVIGASSTLQKEPSEAAEALTTWLQRPDCQLAIPTQELSDADLDVWNRLFKPEVVALLSNEELNAFNVAALRDALLHYETAQSLSAGMTDEVARIQRIFNYVNRVISPEAISSVDLMLSGYEAELFGRGSPEARAWLFANLLRQLKIDAVILRPASGGDGDLWWVGVPVDDKIYLYDCQLGIPVPAPDANFDGQSLMPSPATWSQVVAAPELLTDYRAATGLPASPIDPKRLARPRVELIGPRTHWKKAVQRIELALTTERGVLFDPLQDTVAVVRGLYHRIVDAGDGYWTADAISIWSYPEKYRKSRRPLLDAANRTQATADPPGLTPKQRRLDLRIAPLLGPVLIRSEGPGPPDIQDSKKLWLTRVHAIAGRGGAIVGYLSIKREGNSPDPRLPIGAQALNEQAADEATYWEAHAQYRAGAFDAAMTWIDRYLEGGGDRAAEAKGLRVLCLAELGQWNAAIEAARALPQTATVRPRLIWLANWWESNVPPVAAPQPSSES